MVSQSVQYQTDSCDSHGKSYFWMGQETLKIPFSMHKENRERLCARMAGVPPSSFIFLQGGTEKPKYDTDTNWDFRQESNFQYLFGVKEPGCYGAINVHTKEATLFVPRLQPSYAVFMGAIKPLEWFKKVYEVDRVYYADEISSVLKGDARALYIFQGTNRDSGLVLPRPAFPDVEEFKVVDDETLWDALCECRLIKSAEEIKVMQFACDVTSKAHIEVMLKSKAGNREYVDEATFKYESFIRGCGRVGYNCICPAGERNIVLHYGHCGEPNEYDVPNNALRLMDMGAEYHCYTADVTCTWPMGGKFSAQQKHVYDAVLAAAVAVEKAIKPGVSYRDCHRLSERVMLEEMTKVGMFKGSVDDMVKVNLCSFFMPHGLGHSLGLDVHDVGGYEKGDSRTQEPGLRSLRCGRALLENMIITVEPGFYFNSYLLNQLWEQPEVSKFVNRPMVEEYFSVGGVRIEDDVLVTANGCRVLNSVPRTTEEVEAVMAGAPWTKPGPTYFNA